MKRHLAALLLAAAAPLSVAESTTPFPVKLAIDATQAKGPMTLIWAWCGYDAPKRMGAPSHPTATQDGAATVRMQLPRRAVSLGTLTC